MATTITLPESLEAQLQEQAIARRQSVEDVALALLRDAVEALPPSSELVAIVERIKTTAPASKQIRPAQGSLAEALRADQQYLADVESPWMEWDGAWAEVEEELRSMNRADELRDGGRL